MVYKLSTELSNLRVPVPTYKSFLGKLVIPCSQHLIISNTGAPTHPVDGLCSQDYWGLEWLEELTILQALPDILDMLRAENW